MGIDEALRLESDRMLARIQQGLGLEPTLEPSQPVRQPMAGPHDHDVDDTRGRASNGYDDEEIDDEDILLYQKLVRPVHVVN